MGAQKDTELRVAARTPVPDLAAAISHAIYDGEPVVLRAVGAAAISQAVKAVAVARGFVAPRGFDLAMVPGFTDIIMPDKKVTGMVFRVVIS